MRDFINNIVKEYCQHVTKVCHTEKEFLPGPLPSLSLANRSNFLNSKIQKGALMTRGVKKTREKIKGIEKIFNESIFHFFNPKNRMERIFAF